MNIRLLTISTLYLLERTHSARLHKIFQYLDGFRSDHNLLGVLHIGVDYAVFLYMPKTNDKHLVYELYKVENYSETGMFKPKLEAISKIPIAYIKDQLKIFRSELYRAKYVDDNEVPGLNTKSLRQWQMDRALNFQGPVQEKMPSVL